LDIQGRSRVSRFKKSPVSALVEPKAEQLIGVTV